MQKSQCRNINNTQKKGGMSPSKITDSTVMIPNESDLEELSDKEFKGRITNRFRNSKEA